MRRGQTVEGSEGQQTAELGARLPESPHNLDPSLLFPVYNTYVYFCMLAPPLLFVNYVFGLIAPSLLLGMITGE